MSESGGSRWEGRARERRPSLNFSVLQLSWDSCPGSTVFFRASKHLSVQAQDEETKPTLAGRSEGPSPVVHAGLGGSSSKQLECYNLLARSCPSERATKTPRHISVKQFVLFLGVNKG